MTVSSTSHVVILGAGHAAAQGVFSLRKEGWTGPITLMGDEPVLPYHRPPLSKTYLKGEVTPDDLLIRPRDLYEQNAITLRLGARVVKLDRAARRLQLADGSTITYDQLVLATGAEHRRPAIAGLDLPGVHFLRTVAEADALREAAGHAARVVIIGGGYIGLELAASLRSTGRAVTLLHHGDRILARVTAPEVSAFFTEVHRSEGVTVCTGVVTERIERAGNALCVVSRDGGRWDADLVILGTGAAPSTGLAKAAGLPVEHGILVDEDNRTPDPYIFAMGDCAQQVHPRYGRSVLVTSVQNAVDQAKTVAAVLTGKPAPRRPLPWFWSDQYNIKFQMAGLSAGHTDLVLRGQPDARRCFSVWYFREERLVAVDTINDPLAYVVGSKLIDRDQPVDRALLADPAVDLKTLLARPQESRHD